MSVKRDNNQGKKPTPQPQARNAAAVWSSMKGQEGQLMEEDTKQRNEVVRQIVELFREWFTSSDPNDYATLKRFYQGMSELLDSAEVSIGHQRSIEQAREWAKSPDGTPHPTDFDWVMDLELFEKLRNSATDKEAFEALSEIFYIALETNSVLERPHSLYQSLVFDILCELDQLPYVDHSALAQIMVRSVEVDDLDCDSDCGPSALEIAFDGIYDLGNLSQIIAQRIRDLDSADEAVRAAAKQWCEKMHISPLYIEEFTVESSELLQKMRDVDSEDEAVRAAAKKWWRWQYIDPKRIEMFKAMGDIKF